VPLESFGIGGWVRSLALLAVALVAPIACTIALLRGRAAPSFARMLGRASERPRDVLALFLGSGLVLLTLLAIQPALALLFDPRYRDFPFAPLTAGAVPYAVLALLMDRPEPGASTLAETIAAIVLALSAIYIAINETFANWQAVWLSVLLLVLALTLARGRA